MTAPCPRCSRLTREIGQLHDLISALRRQLANERHQPITADAHDLFIAAIRQHDKDAA